MLQASGACAADFFDSTTYRSTTISLVGPSGEGSSGGLSIIILRIQNISKMRTRAMCDTHGGPANSPLWAWAYTPCLPLTPAPQKEKGAVSTERALLGCQGPHFTGLPPPSRSPSGLWRWTAPSQWPGLNEEPCISRVRERLQEKWGTSGGSIRVSQWTWMHSNISVLWWKLGYCGLQHQWFIPKSQQALNDKMFLLFYLLYSIVSWAWQP